MKRLSFLLSASVTVVALSVAHPVSAVDGAPAELATQRRVHGVITAVDGSTLTIATEKATVTGKLDASRTRVTVHGKPARAADLRLTAHAKAELCLDDVWVLVATH